MNVKELIKQLVDDGRLAFHHTAAGLGYVSRRSDGYIHPYKGRFGKGVVVYRPRWDTTRYFWVDYYIAQDEETYAQVEAKLTAREE